MRKTKDIIEQKQQKLLMLQGRSSRALDIVTATINELSDVNDDIDKTIVEITEAKTKLQNTEDSLNTTRLHNTKIINKFKALIED